MPQPRSLHEYYATNSILPTFHSFGESDRMAGYEAHRRRFFREKLKLPQRMFVGASVLEFGPDSGENAVILAGWGANLTLVEPNRNAWQAIEDNFRRYELSDRLAGLVRCDLESFTSEQRFDFILAEGFISHIRPEEIWINKFAELLSGDGFVIISNNDYFGMATEFLHKSIWSAVHRLRPQEADGIVRRIFKAKWDSIPHTRSFDSWEMDNLRNPLMRKRQFFDTADLLVRAVRGGLGVYSSWPVYADSLEIHWHKRRPDPASDHLRAVETVKRSRLSHMLGAKMFICGDSAMVERAGAVLEQLIGGLDAAIDDCTPDVVRTVSGLCSGLAALIDNPLVLADSTSAKAAAHGRLAVIARVLDLIAAGQLEELESYCNQDVDFIEFWGQPHHYVVFERQAGLAG